MLTRRGGEGKLTYTTFRICQLIICNTTFAVILFDIFEGWYLTHLLEDVALSHGRQASHGQEQSGYTKWCIRVCLIITELWFFVTFMLFTDLILSLLNYVVPTTSLNDSNLGTGGICVTNYCDLAQKKKKAHKTVISNVTTSVVCPNIHVSEGAC